MPKLIGMFNKRTQAEEAVSLLREQGFEKEISILGKDTEKRKLAQVIIWSVWNARRSTLMMHIRSYIKQERKR